MGINGDKKLQFVRIFQAKNYFFAPPSAAFRACFKGDYFAYVCAEGRGRRKKREKLFSEFQYVVVYFDDSKIFAIITDSLVVD